MLMHIPLRMCSGARRLKCSDRNAGGSSFIENVVNHISVTSIEVWNDFPFIKPDIMATCYHSAHILGTEKKLCIQ